MVGAIVELEERIQLQEEQNEKLRKKIRYCRYATVLFLVLTLIILLYSCTTSQIDEVPVVDYYVATFSADILGVNVEDIETITTEELLTTSQEHGYIANCLEFYYDGIRYDMEDGSTVYYSVDSLRDQLDGAEINYSLRVFEKGNECPDSATEIVSTAFEYGFADGSCQMALPETTDLVFSGYSKELIDRYMAVAETKYAVSSPVTLVIDGSYEITAETINSMLKGVLRDTYRLDTTTAYYGLYSDGDVLEYVNTSGERVDISNTVESNLESILGTDITLTYQIPKKITQPLTVIYLNTVTYNYDDFYFANALNLY